MTAIDDNFNNAFLDTNDFAVSAKVTPISGAAKSIKVIFDNEYFASQLAGGIGVDTADPQIICKTSDIAGLTQGASIKIGTAAYYVTSIEPDGTGMARVTLSKNTVT